ncbi:chemotaxis protein CheD [Archaeoglobus veneficus]|uniref:Probable chemoreceptor glutamine deamidase CheD n=1 Tax=Archaeoglobus veneficus (strain DSM 11195 / SNP6) TaxID=693661 RepID=F2KP64_ARCVS|nr:chemotaxis protein CheD [Archaeoglobus veneficus]AEA47468.1 CheD [Archaeoglobus veneficus SNP6]
MAERIRVRMAEYKVCNSGGILVTTVGSCVAIGLVDPVAGVGGLAHIMLPEANGKSDAVGKYADTAIPAMLKEMEKKRAKKERIIAKIAGGARMFNFSSDKMEYVGDRNVEAVRRILKKYGIRIAGEDVGKNHGRTVEFHTSDGRMIIKRANEVIKEL